MTECCTSGADRAAFIRTRHLVAFVITFCLECSEIGTSGIRKTTFLNTISGDRIFFCGFDGFGFLVED